MLVLSALLRFMCLVRLAFAIRTFERGSVRAVMEDDVNYESSSPLTTLKSAEGSFTSDKFEYNPLTGVDDKMTVIALLEAAARENGDAVAFQWPKQDAKGNLVNDKKYRLGNFTKGLLGSHRHYYLKVTWKQYRDLVMDAAAAFISMGLQPMDAVNIRGVNSAEWLIAFMGCIAAGGLPVGLYPTDSPDALKFKATDSGAAFIVLGRAKDLGIYSKFMDELTSVKRVILWDSNPKNPDKPKDEWVQIIGKDRFMRWADFMAEGGKKFDFQGALPGEVDYHKEVKKRIEATMPGQAGSVVYTSGTTGNPKGVLLSQDNLAWSAKTIVDKVLTKEPPNGEFRLISYLPLNHVAGQMMDIMGPLYISSKKGRHATVFFPAMCYVKRTCTVEQLADTRPVIFLGVPEVWDGMKLKIEQATKNPLVTRLKDWVPSVFLNKVGLDKTLYAVSGAGPIRKDTLVFFNNMGLQILNMFAQSESSGIGTAWTREDFTNFDLSEKFGSIGQPLGNEVVIDKPKGDDKGEIKLKGRNVMLGYLNRPEKTDEAIQDDWLLTGDQGKQDADGFVFLTGRLKEIMKTFGGEMIAPVAIEEGIVKACNKPGETILQHVILVGDNKYYTTALVTLLEDQEEGIPTGNLQGPAKHVDSSVTVSEARKSTTWAARLSQCIGEYNKVAAKTQEKVFRYLILPKAITVEFPDLMTPTQKIKRSGVSELYEKQIEKCGGDDPLEGRDIQACPE